MSDCYEWFSPFQARDDAAYWEERSYCERRDLEREIDMYRGAAKSSEAHLRYLMGRMADAYRLQVQSQPIVMRAADLSAFTNQGG